MTIEEALKSSLGLRLSNHYAGRWLVWSYDQWVVYEHKPGLGHSREVVITEDLSEALKALAESEGVE